MNNSIADGATALSTVKAQLEQNMDAKFEELKKAVSDAKVDMETDVNEKVQKLVTFFEVYFVLEYKHFRVLWYLSGTDTRRVSVI
ncbi:hypothetical protein OCU04_004083 [Sclerotinia nivalis]|uniref:Uncharacterized protein n=1 Tax=Sclerotinia nivalis TaxID=352851 RepID=A0A9X0AWP1_9HELO|nr:hypothetical protein OCU04_004083 [Sclerotinia nivalis]